MFDIGFWELTLMAVIGLIVLGPERLPVVARTLGLWVGRAKGYVRGITSEIEREVRVDDIRNQVRETREQIESDTRDAITPAHDALATEKPSVKSAASDRSDSPAAGENHGATTDAAPDDDTRG